MAIQILSDLHLEMSKEYEYFKITPKTPYLALLGDVGNLTMHKDDYLAFLTSQLRGFEIVFFVPGNHEAYGLTWSKALDILQTFEQLVRNDISLGQFVLLNRTTFLLPETNVVVLGCSLFSFAPPESEKAVSFGLNDYWQIEDWDVDLHNQAHRQDLAWLNAQVSEAEQRDLKIIILSHWSPSLDPRAVELKHRNSPIKSAFSSDLSEEICFKSGKVKVWAFGHTHHNCDFTVERDGGAEPLRLLANQRGYHFAQAQGFDGEKVVTI